MQTDDYALWVEKIEFTADQAEVTYQVQGLDLAPLGASVQLPFCPQGGSVDQLVSEAFDHIRQRLTHLSLCSSWTFGSPL